jgi:hypothetical protein
LAKRLPNSLIGVTSCSPIWRTPMTSAFGSAADAASSRRTRPQVLPVAVHRHGVGHALRRQAREAGEQRRALAAVDRLAQHLGADGGQRPGVVVRPVVHDQHARTWRGRR